MLWRIGASIIFVFDIFICNVIIKYILSGKKLINKKKCYFNYLYITKPQYSKLSVDILLHVDKITNGLEVDINTYYFLNDINI